MTLLLHIDLLIGSTEVLSPNYPPTLQCLLMIPIVAGAISGEDGRVWLHLYEMMLWSEEINLILNTIRMKEVVLDSSRRSSPIHWQGLGRESLHRLVPWHVHWEPGATAPEGSEETIFILSGLRTGPAASACGSWSFVSCFILFDDRLFFLLYFCEGERSHCTLCKATIKLWLSLSGHQQEGPPPPHQSGPAQGFSCHCCIFGGQALGFCKTTGDNLDGNGNGLNFGQNFVHGVHREITKTIPKKCLFWHISLL